MDTGQGADGRGDPQLEDFVVLPPQSEFEYVSESGQSAAASAKRTQPCRLPSQRTSSSMHSQMESMEGCSSLDSGRHQCGRQPRVSAEYQYQSVPLVDAYDGGELAQSAASSSDINSFNMQSSYVRVDEDLMMHMEGSATSRQEALPAACSVVLRHDKRNSPQHVIQSLRAVVRGITRVDAAYIAHAAHTSGSAVICVCDQTDAATYAGELACCNLDSAAAPPPLDSVPAGPLFGVVLHTERNDMRHMLYILSTLRSVVHWIPEIVAREAMQEAQYQGMARVCVCHQDEAEAYAAALRGYGLSATVEPHAIADDHATWVEAARLAISLTRKA